jgi:hypothetical protein
METNKKQNQLRITGLYALRGLAAPRPPQRPGHSATLYSHAVAPAQFVGPGLCFAKPLSGPPNRRIQPERYATLPLTKVVK